jgi:beta-glucosidase
MKQPVASTFLCALITIAIGTLAPTQLVADPMLTPTTVPIAATHPVYLDITKPVNIRVNDLIGRLSLTEKANLLNHVGAYDPVYGIQPDRWNQCLHGVWWDRPTTDFPSSIALAATWNPPLAKREASAISDEARAIYNGWHIDANAAGEHKGLIYRAPVINISRNPYWGRINECYGEDPYLTGRIGVAYVEGLQGDNPAHLKIAATLKHFAVNNVETNRQGLSATVSERMLHEYWLPHFRDCIVEGKASSIMASYNAINGVPNAVNKPLLTDILKDEWGFQGFVVSDLGGIGTMMEEHMHGKVSPETAVAESVDAGCDFSDQEFADNIPAAVRDGLIPESRLDDALRRVLRIRFRLGDFDPWESDPYSSIPISVIGSEQHRLLARKVAEQSIVLLTNPQQLLPLNASKIRSIVVIGEHAVNFQPGSYFGSCLNPVTPLDGIKSHVATDTAITYVQGNSLTITTMPSGAPGFVSASGIAEAVEAAKKADVAIVFVGTTLQYEAEGIDRHSLELPTDQQQLVDAVMDVNPKTIVVEMNAGPLAVPTIASRAGALVEAWWNGEEGGNALAEVLFGKVNPSGKMPLTVYAADSQVPPQDQYDISKGFTYMYLNEKPLFAFGHGLSYTTFDYSNMHISNKKLPGDGELTVSIDVSNVGKMAGDDVPQLYCHLIGSPLPQPKEKLIGFDRVSLAPGEKTTVHFVVPARRLSYYDVTVHKFAVKPSDVKLMVGAASDDIRASDIIRITSPATWAP